MQLQVRLSQCWCCFWIFIKTSCFSSDLLINDPSTTAQSSTTAQLHNTFKNHLMDIWEQALSKSRRLICAVSLQKTAAALWNINTWNKQNKKIWACCWSVLGFSCISVRILFFCLQLHMSCMWHYHTKISNPSTHITSEATQAPSGFMWCFLRFSHRDSPSQIKVFDIPYGLSLSKRHVFINQYFVCFPSKTCTIGIFNLRSYGEKRTISQ